MDAAQGQEPRSPRQLEFITAAARLFAARGYHAVGINDISAELGLSGPAIYRHYPSKEALLVAVLDEAIVSHLSEVRSILSTVHDPREVLGAIVANHIDFVFEQAENIITWRTEVRTLPPASRRRLRVLQRLYTEEWVRVVRTLRPDLDDDEARALCDAVISLIQSPTEFRSRLAKDRLAPLLAGMAMEAVLGPAVVPVNATRAS